VTPPDVRQVAAVSGRASLPVAAQFAHAEVDAHRCARGDECNHQRCHRLGRFMALRRMKARDLMTGAAFAKLRT
jgi:hypothetical protein